MTRHLRLREEIVLRRFDVYDARGWNSSAERDEYEKLHTWEEKRNFRARVAVRDAIADADIILAALYPQMKVP
ncbi:MAG TPA: hypothetical protein VGB13_13435 [Candidatus Krumholzibacteria bacterium]